MTQSRRTEIDLLCISNGRLICGEVKSSASEFTEEELSKLARIAADIRAEEATISAFNDPSGLMSHHAEALAKLLPAGCTATICGPAQWAFDPRILINLGRVELERSFQEFLDRGCSYNEQKFRWHESVGRYTKHCRFGGPHRPGALCTLTPSSRSTKTVRFHFRIVRRVVNQHVTFRAVTG